MDTAETVVEPDLKNSHSKLTFLLICTTTNLCLFTNLTGFRQGSETLLFCSDTLATFERKSVTQFLNPPRFYIV